MTNATHTLFSKLTLKSFKTVRWMSEETICFTATVLLDGKVVGTASNEGHGGCTFIHYVSANAEATTQAFAKTISPSDFKGWEFRTEGFDVTDLVDILVEKIDQQKHTEKMVKKMRKAGVELLAYVTTDGQKGAYRAFKKNPLRTPQAIETLKAGVKAKADFKCFISEMTDAEIIQHFVF